MPENPEDPAPETDDLLAEADAHLARLSAAAFDILSERIPSLRFDTASVDPALPEGTVVGEHRVVRELGRGGMGSVYLADRSDGEFRHRVAVKVLRRGLDSEDILERFRRERQILASMRHPGIASLVGGGSLPDGRPYLAMELVEGVPIDEYCARAGGPLEDRLLLFLQVTDAVEYAHRHLVVHRDLKPSNILVSEEGRVRLLDFGIAKVLEEEGGEPPDRTGHAARLLTPAYASPEQLRGEPITTASDIYQLGLLLHRLLTGSLPSRSEPEERPRPLLLPPSTAVGSDRPDLRRRLKGDLDAIVLKALRPDPDDRYPAVTELAADIRRFLQGLPVAARRGSRWYHARRFAMRRRIPLAAAGCLALLLALHGVGIARERDRARMEERKADLVMGLLMGMFESVDPNLAGGREITVREVLDDGVAGIGEDLPPEVTMELLSLVGRVYHGLGLFGEARPLLTRAVEARSPSDPQRADDLRRLALVSHLGDLPFAIETLREALDAAERTRSPQDPLIAEILVDLANLLPSEERQPLLDRAFTLLRSTTGDVRALLAHALTIQAYSGDPELPPEEHWRVTEARHREALALRRDVWGSDHSSVASSMADLATLLEYADPGASDSLHHEAIEIFTRILGPDHMLRLSTVNNYAAVLRDRGEHEAAEPLFREVLERRRAAYPEAEVLNVYPMYGLGWVLAETGRAVEAEPLLQEVNEVLTRHFGNDDVRVQAARSTLGRALALQGRFPESEALLLASYAWERDEADERAWGRTAARLADLYEAWGRREEAARYREAVPIL